MSSASWERIIVIALLAVACEVLLGFSLFFSPGWANDWPFGLTIHAIWSCGMAIILFLVLMTLAIGVGAAAGLICSRRGIGQRYGRLVYAAWLIGTGTLALVVSLWTYPLPIQVSVRSLVFPDSSLGGRVFTQSMFFRIQSELHSAYTCLPEAVNVKRQMLAVGPTWYPSPWPQEAKVVMVEGTGGFSVRTPQVSS